MIRFLTIVLATNLLTLRDVQAFLPLISRDEAMTHNSEEGIYLAPSNLSQGLGPTIELMSPVLSGEILKNPIKLELLFKQSVALIDFSSLKILYGRARFDITSRVLGRAIFNGNKLTLEEAHLPDGNHLISVIIFDVAGRHSRRDFMLHIK